MKQLLATYRYGQLQPVRAPGAASYNARWLGPGSLGIEVTEPELAGHCGLGNIDPQHLGRDPATAAIDLALNWPVPPPGARFVTIRKDADACGAMAVLTLRCAGRAIEAAWRKRIALVSAADRFAMGAWPGRRALPAAAEEIEELGTGLQYVNAMRAGALVLGPLDVTVGHFIRWIGGGQTPEVWLARASDAAKVLLIALHSGKVVVREAIPGTVAIVEGFAPGAVQMGYRLAPIVVAERFDGAQRRVAIAQYEPGRADLGAVARELSAFEAGWGGSPTIIGSPQGVSCATPVERCIEVLPQLLK